MKTLIIFFTCIIDGAIILGGIAYYMFWVAMMSLFMGQVPQKGIVGEFTENIEALMIFEPEWNFYYSNSKILLTARIITFSVFLFLIFYILK